MSGTSKGRKSKNMRPGSKKNSGQNQTPPYDGAYGNARLVHVLLSVMGKKCKAKVRNGGIYEGIFHAFNPKMDVSINEVHKCDKNYHHNSTTNGIDGSKDVADCPREEELIGEMAFPSGSLVSATFEDVDMSFAQLEVNEANGESTSQPRSNFKSSEKKLEPWNGGGDSELDPLTAGGLEGGLGSDSTNGWGADEMFRTNQEKYGVKSDYDSSLSNYTMQLDIKDKDDDAIAKATRLAQEIESGSDYKRRIDLELDDGTTEEDKFSAVTRDRKDRGSREMRDRDNMRDIRDGGEGYREKDRGDRERDRDHPISPQGYRNSKHDYDRFHLPNRNRGRGRDSWDKRNQQGYTGSNMGPPRSMGSGNQSSGGGRNQQPMSPIDGPTGAGGSQNKPYRGPSSGQTHLPPRFTKTGSGGHSREDDRMRQNESNSMHSPYQAPKGSRQRMQRSGGRQPAWGGPTSPPAEYQHHSPTQMHQDPAVISSGPSAGGSGGPPLSRSSSNSSNTSAPVQQNHRKHLSTSSQDEQTTPQHPSAQQHHPHLRQTPSSSSPTGGPPLTKNQQQPPQQPSRPPQMPPPMPGTGPTGDISRKAGVAPSLPRQKVIACDFCPRILKRQVKPSQSTEQSKAIIDTRQVVKSSPKKENKFVKRSDDVKNSPTHRRAEEKPYNNVQIYRPRIAKPMNRAKRDLKFDDMPSSSSNRNIVHERVTLHQSDFKSENFYSSEEPYYEQHQPVSVTNPKQLQPVRLTVSNQYMNQPVYHHHQHAAGLQYIIIHNPGVIHDGAGLLPVHGHQIQDPNSWASIASRNPVSAKQIGHGMSDMGPSHIGQGSPSGIPQQSPRSSIMPGIVNVRSNATYTWTPRGGTPPTSNMPNPYPVPQSMNQQMPNMGNPRVHPSSQQMHPMGGGDHMQGQMVPRGPPPQQIVTSPQQQQHTMQPQMPAMPGQHGPRPAQPGMKVAPTTMPQENSQKVQPEKSEENMKPVIKKPMDAPPSQSPGGSAITELKEFSQRFKLPTDMKKDTTKQSSTPQPVNQQPPPQQQRPPQNMTQAYPSPQQQHGYQHPPPHQSQSYNTGAMGHPEHGRSNIQHNMQQNQVSIQQGNQMIQQQQKSVHPSHPGPVNQIPSHPQQMSHVQIPMAAPSIQQFAAPVPSSQHPPMQLPPRPMDSPKILTNRMMQQPDKNIPPVRQKPLTSPKADMSNFQQHNANIHVVVTGTPVPQTNPSAVITVSAAASSPIVSPHAPAPVPQNPQPQRQSPVTDQAAPPSSTPSIEPSTTPGPSTPQSSNAAITSPTAGIKALNPEAQEFKPRTTPAKPSPVATRATTPQANMPIYVPAYVSAAVASGMGPQTPTQIATPVYNSAQVPQMHAPEMPQMYTQYPQQYIPLVQQIPGQQFAAAFDQAGQAVYASPAPQQAMMAQNARMAATIQGTPQQHIPQYQSDQGQGAVYVPVPPQGPNFMQQRPHSAHTPTQVTHVTAASPATQANQQSQQPTGHPTQTMVHGVQTAPVWMPINPSSNIMMVPSGQPPQQLQHASGMQMNAPPPQHTHYLSALPAGQIPSSVPMNNPAQQKGQQQQQMTGHYMPQPQQRSYGQYQSPSANNQG